MKNIKIESQKKLDKIVLKLKCAYPHSEEFNKKICIYACGSLGRLELAEASDLDLFFIIMDTNKQEKDEQYSNIDKYNFFSNLYTINKELGYKDPSKNGLYWNFINIDKLLDIGSREEDFNNSFTARMLLLLESKPLYNKSAYNQLVKLIIDKYFVDYKVHGRNFYPLFLMNDILRYWYTLTLNYEYRRDNKDTENEKNWKRLKLKYARFITCFSMIACLYKKDITRKFVIDCVKKTPFERLHMLSLYYEDIKHIIKEIEIKYKWFLDLRKEMPEWWDKASNKKSAKDNAESFHKIVLHELLKTLSHANPELRNRTDSY